MPRADELTQGDRVRHPVEGHVVEVTRTGKGLSRLIVYWRALGGRFGSFTVQPHTELEDCS